jgi:hypothetical protein
MTQQPEKVCNTCRAAYPATTRYFHADTKKDRLAVECKTCKIGRVRDSKMSPEDKIAERLKLAAHRDWFVQHMPEYLSPAQQAEVRARLRDELEFDTGWKQPEPPEPKTNGRWGGLTDEEIQAMIMPRSDPQNNSESNS